MSLKTIDIESLSKNISSLLSLLIKFENILVKEASVLKTSDIDILIKIVNDKQAISQQIEKTFSLLSKSANNTTKDFFSISSFMEKDNFRSLPAKLQETFKKVELITVSCHDKNIANGISVQTLNNFNETFLQLYHGQDPQSKTYTSTGSSSTSSNKSTTLGKA